jgi:hypothetical protein
MDCFQCAGLWKAFLVNLYSSDNEMLFLVAGIYRSPFAEMQLFGIYRVHGFAK